MYVKSHLLNDSKIVEIKVVLIANVNIVVCQEVPLCTTCLLEVL